MAGPLPVAPNNFLAQPGNGTVYLSWDPVVSATSYTILRSTDNVTFSTLASGILVPNYTDSTAVVGTQYWYQAETVNSNGTSSPTASYTVVCVNYGQMSLLQVRNMAKQRADMVNSGFVSKEEWNSYINQSYTELYDILVQTYADDYYVATPYQFTTDGRYPALYDLPDDLYKLLGVDLGIGAAGANGWMTLRKFSFVSRNRYIYGNTPTSWLGILNLRYRIVGSQLDFVPQPQSGVTIQLWYIPRPSVLLADSAILDGISGWAEYVVVDAAIKAMQKEESDVTVLMAQKQALLQRINAAASNRDAGMPEGQSDVRNLDGSYFGGPFSDVPSGGY